MKQNINITLPKTILKRYDLCAQEKTWGQSASIKGVYFDKKTNKKVFIKISPNRNSLYREYICQKLFYEQSKKLILSNVIIPKPLEILELKDYSILVMEYFYGKSLLRADVKTRLNAYMVILKFLEKINTETNIGNKYGMRQKSAANQLVTLPYFFSKSLVFYFSYSSLFIRSVCLIASMISKWRKLDTSWICHGDINVTNMLLFEKKVVMLDFACVYKSHRFFDISRALNSTWYQKEFHGKFWNNIISEFRFTTQEQNFLNSFVVLNLMQRLSQRYKNSNQERFYIMRLKTLLNVL